MDVARVKAQNPSPLTLDGTNTWVVGRAPCWVIDPGPELEAHLDAVAAEAAARGGAAGLLLTHHHGDHSEAVEPLGARLGVGLVAPDAGPFRVVPTPGHTADHVAYVLPGGLVATGDAVLGEGSVFVAPEPGALRAYLGGLAALRELEPSGLLPGHGPPVEDAIGKLDEYVAHRLERERALVAALDRGLRGHDDLLDAAWGDVPGGLRFAAAVVLTAHLHKLQEEGGLPDGVTWPDISWLDSQSAHP